MQSANSKGHSRKAIQREYASHTLHPQAAKMKDYTCVDISTQPGARRVIKKPVPVSVRFARKAGVLQTLEGPVSYKARDALLTGSVGEEWPVPRASFMETYAQLPPTKAGRPGLYAKRPLPVWAIQIQDDFCVQLAEGGGILRGAPGDWLVQYGLGDYGIVRADIFEDIYTDAIKPIGSSCARY